MIVWQSCDGSAVHRAWRAAWRPPERRPIYEFAAEHICFGAESPFPGAFKVANTPFVRAPLDALRRDDIEIVDLSGFAQSAKSTAASLFTADCVLHNPGSLTWNSPTKDAARKAAEKKLWPIFRRCKPIADKIPPKSGFLTIRFPDAPLYVQTASEGNAHGDTVRYQVNDDVHIWLPGRLEQFEKRTAAFSGQGRKIFNLSTGQTKTHEERLPDGTLIERGCDAFESWMKGTRSLWSVRCPACKQVQPLAWRHRGEDGRLMQHADGRPVFGIEWTTNESTRPGGRWDWAAVAKTARWHCRNSSCGHEISDTRANRRALNSPAKGADFVDTNPAPMPGRWSGRYPAMASELLPWGKLVTEWLYANDCLAAGNIKPLEEFVMNRLAEPFFDGHTSEGDRRGSSDYKLADPWLDEAGLPCESKRFLLVDTQEEGGFHLKALLRVATVEGRSRHYGYWNKLTNFEELRALQLEQNVTDARVLVDVGDGNNVREIYAAIARYGWTGLKGSAAEGFPHPCPRNPGQTILRPWSRAFYGDPQVGKAKAKGKPGRPKGKGAARRPARPGGLIPGLARCYHWSNPMVKDVLARLRAGEGVYWGRPSDEDPEYTDGLYSEVRKQFLGRNGRPFWRWSPVKRNNHPWDMECEAIVAMLMSGLLTPPEPPPELTAEDAATPSA